jgi:hypothetical protein
MQPRRRQSGYGNRQSDLLQIRTPKKVASRLFIRGAGQAPLPEILTPGPYRSKTFIGEENPQSELQVYLNSKQVSEQLLWPSGQTEVVAPPEVARAISFR